MPVSVFSPQTISQIERLSVPVPAASMICGPVKPDLLLKRGASPVNSYGDALALP